MLVIVINIQLLVDYLYTGDKFAFGNYKTHTLQADQFMSRLMVYHHHATRFSWQRS